MLDGDPEKIFRILLQCNSNDAILTHLYLYVLTST
jgi:hypothetical protein